MLVIIWLHHDLLAKTEKIMLIVWFLWTIYDEGIFHIQNIILIFFKIKIVKIQKYKAQEKNYTR